jgi:hypothetical protein
MIRKKLLDDYSPLYFLAALGAGGVAITFFIYLMFLVPHPDTPMVTFNHLWPIVTGPDPVQAVLVGAAMLAIALFSLLHLRLLAWNLVEYRRFQRTDAYRALRSSNNEATLMALPLTLSMSINVMFVNGAVFVPELWTVVEYLFPFALAAFLAVGVLALRLYARYFTRVISSGDFNMDENNSLAQMIAVFAFAMISVGMAAPGAMSHTLSVSAIGIFGAIFFGTVAVSMGLLKFVMGFKSMLNQGIAPAASPSLWIVIPILTLLGIALIRITHGLSHGFDAPLPAPWLFVLLSSLLSLQLLFGLFGYAVMKRIGYFDDFLRGEQRHAGSYALICPGVALFVFGMFFIHVGLLKNGLVEQFSAAYFIAMAPLVFLQIKTIGTLLRLNGRLLRAPRRDGDDGAGGIEMAVTGREA